MPLPLIEASKLAANQGQFTQSGIIQEIARTSDLLLAMPFMNITGAAYVYRREDTLPGVGYRGVNEGYSDSFGIINPQVEVLKILGGDIKVDRFIVDTLGEEARTTQTMMQSKAIALSTTRDLIKGDSRINPRVPDGLQPRCTGSQLIANAPAGAPLSLLKLDELIDTVDQPQYLLMSKAMRRRISAIIRNTTVGGFISYGVDALGRQVTKYNDIPIMIVDYDNNNDQILPFTEASPDASAVTSTSIYCISFADGMVTGLQGAVAGQYGISARDLNEMEGLPHLLTRVEWYMALAVRHGRSVARLHGITDAPVAV